MFYSFCKSFFHTTAEFSMAISFLIQANQPKQGPNIGKISTNFSGVLNHFKTCLESPNRSLPLAPLGNTVKFCLKQNGGRLKLHINWLLTSSTISRFCVILVHSVKNIILINFSEYKFCFQIYIRFLSFDLLARATRI